jgi:hypothetical protein
MFVSHLLARTIRVEADLVDQLFNSSEKRLARALLLLANFGKEGRPEPIVAKISQETLAEMIGTTRARVSFFMNKFRKLGLIDYNGHLEIHSSLLNVVLHDEPHDSAPVDKDVALLVVDGASEPYQLKLPSRLTAAGWVSSAKGTPLAVTPGEVEAVRSSSTCPTSPKKKMTPLVGRPVEPRSLSGPRSCSDGLGSLRLPDRNLASVDRFDGGPLSEFKSWRGRPPAANYRPRHGSAPAPVCRG